MTDASRSNERSCTVTTAGHGQVRERGSEPAKRARHRPEHAHLLGAGRQVDRIDAGRYEIRSASEGGEAELAAGQLRQATEQVLDIGLVAGPLPAQHVRIDYDEGGAHPATSR